MRAGSGASIARRRLVLASLALPALGWNASAWAATLPAPASLAAELAGALARKQPLVVMASLDGCPFCRVVRDSHLAPLRAESGLPVVQLDTASTRAVLDFAGTASTHDQLLRAWGVATWPTVLFFGAQGKEVAERLVGASIPDFYGAYLDERLAAARRRLGS
ncbi:MAG: thioredoxin fold domain-containing protein [Pseudomonadota bacterium]